MSRKKPTSPIEAATEKLRSLALATKNGDLLGGEEALIARLGVSRTTVRQVARLLEREGLLSVRRGINGGYFAARPDEQTLESAVSAYLDTLDMDPQDVTTLASVLWVEAIRKASELRSKAVKATARHFAEKFREIPDDAPFSTILAIETESRNAIFKLIRGRYIEFIFHINIAFSRRHFVPSGEVNASVQTRFVRAWRAAKIMEFTAVAEGSTELATTAARHSRSIWHERVWGLFGVKVRSRNARSTKKR